MLNEPASINCATRLLFAILSLAAFQPNPSTSCQYRRLKQNLQLAVSFYGQEFMCSPPTHQDTVLVSLFLSDYKPAALATMQGVAHKTIKSEIYINIAYGVFHRLEAITEEGNQDPSGLNSADYHEFEKCLFDSIQGFKIISNHATVDGLIRKPLHSLHYLAGYMKSRVDAYQNALKSRQCTPRAIYHIQWATSTYILFQTLIDVRNGLSNPRGFINIAEETERKCSDQIKYTNSLLAVSNNSDMEEITAVSSVTELRFRTVSNWGIALGMLYTSTLGIRLRDGTNDDDSDLSCNETIQITSQVVNTYNGLEDQANEHFREYLERFGITYTDQLLEILELFIQCTKMKLKGIDFHPPPRYFGLETVTLCKNLLENNIVNIKSFGYLHPEFPRQLDLFTKCAQQLANMASSPGTTAEAAFAGGCVYAMSSKIIFGLISLMERLKKNFSRDEEKVEIVDGIITSAEYNGLPGVGAGQFSENLDLLPSFEDFGQAEALPASFDWFSLINFDDPGFQPEDPAWFSDPFR